MTDYRFPEFVTAAGLRIPLPYDFHSWTIRDRVLYLLKQAFAAGEDLGEPSFAFLTTSDFLNLALYSFRNRIDELGDDGYNTERERIKGRSIWRYRLTQLDRQEKFF